MKSILIPLLTVLAIAAATSALGQERDRWLGGGEIHRIEAVSRSAGTITVDGTTFSLPGTAALSLHRQENEGLAGGQRAALESLEPGSLVQLWFDASGRKVVFFRRVEALESIEGREPR